MKTLVLVCTLAAVAVGAPAHAGDASRVLLEANFDLHPLDQQIGTGGPSVGEPVSIHPDLSAIVRALPLSTPSLELSHAASGIARSARFEFPGSEEIIHGDLNIRLVIQASQLDFFNVDVREQGASADKFLDISLLPDGDISLSDEAGVVGTIGTYVPNVDFLVRIRFHMDADTYDVSLDTVTVVSGRSHGVIERGVGALLIGTSHQTAAGSLFHVDDIRVVRGDGIFLDGFDGAIPVPRPIW